MDYSKKQQELDVKKWVDSESKNYDTCGEYGYCKNCNKSNAYPCAYAYESYTNSSKLVKPQVKSTTKASQTIKTSKSTCKKTTSKKSTSKVAA